MDVDYNKLILGFDQILVSNRACLTQTLGACLLLTPFVFRFIINL